MTFPNCHAARAAGAVCELSKLPGISPGDDSSRRFCSGNSHVVVAELIESGVARSIDEIGIIASIRIARYLAG